MIDACPSASRPSRGPIAGPGKISKEDRAPRTHRSPILTFHFKYICSRLVLPSARGATRRALAHDNPATTASWVSVTDCASRYHPPQNIS